MANTYTLISSYTVGSGGILQVDFTSIPATYTDLNVLITMRNTHNNYGGFYIRFNSNSSSYTQRRIKGEGTAVNNDTSIESAWEQSNWTASTFGNGSIYIPNYTSSNYKSVSIDIVNENNGTDARDTLGAFLWSNSSAITSISFSTFDSGFPDKFAQYSTFYLYGIKNS